MNLHMIRMKPCKKCGTLKATQWCDWCQEFTSEQVRKILDVCRSISRIS